MSGKPLDQNIQLHIQDEIREGWMYPSAQGRVWTTYLDHNTGAIDIQMAGEPVYAAKAGVILDAMNYIPLILAHSNERTAV